MSDIDTLRQKIVENASSPNSITTRDGSQTSQDLNGQIAAARFVADCLASGDAFSAMRPRKMVPPSSIGSKIGPGP